MNNKILEINNLTLSNRKSKSDIVRNLSINIEKGESVLLWGENGSGKSLTCKTVFSLLPKIIAVKAGSIVFDSKHDILARGKELYGNRIIYLGQNAYKMFNPFKKIGRQIKEYLEFSNARYNKKIHKDVKNHFMDRVHLFGIKSDMIREKWDCYPQLLSGGEKQQFLISMNLAFANPDLIIADEFVSNLDLLSQKAMLEALFNYKKNYNKNTGLLLVTHEFSLVDDFIDSVYIYKTIKGTNDEAYPFTAGGKVKKAKLQDNNEKLSDFLYKEFENRKRINFSQKKENIKGELLKVSNLTKQFVSGNGAGKKNGSGNNGKTGKFTGINDLSFMVKKGEITGIVGPFGSGKSTIAHLIMQYLKPDYGNPFMPLDNSIKDFFPNKSNNNQKINNTNIQMIFQHIEFNPFMTVNELIDEPLSYDKTDDSGRIYKTIFEEFNEYYGEGILNSHSCSLSGGQKKLIALIRAFSMNPNMVIADEPTHALSIWWKNYFVEILLKYRNEGNSALIISHDLDLIHKVADRILFIDSGKLRFQSKYSELVNYFENEQYSYLKKFFLK